LTITFVSTILVSTSSYRKFELPYFSFVLKKNKFVGLGLHFEACVSFLNEKLQCNTLSYHLVPQDMEREDG